MNAKKVVGVTLLWGVFGGAAYAVYWFYRQKSLASKTSIKYGKLELVDFDFPKISVNLFLKLMNESDIPLTVQGYEFDIFVNGKPLSTASWAGNVNVESGKSTLFPIRINLDLKQFAQSGLKSLLVFMQNLKSPLGLLIKGKVSVKTSFATVNNLPVEQTFDLGKLLRDKMIGK